MLRFLLLTETKKNKYLIMVTWNRCRPIVSQEYFIDWSVELHHKIVFDMAHVSFYKLTS